MKQGLTILTILLLLTLSRASSAQNPDPKSAEKTVEVSIYGRFIPFLEGINTSGASSAGAATQVLPGEYTGTDLRARARMTTGTTYLGFKGGLKLHEDSGLKVVWQIETSVGLDGDGLAVFAGRNTGVGLGSNYGTVIYALWDTPYKFLLPQLTPMRGATPFDNNSIMANPGFNVPATTTQTTRSGGKPDAAFHRRQGNSIQYWSPTFSGVSARLAYSINEGKTFEAPIINPQVFTAMLAYENGPVAVRGAYELHVDYFGMAQLGGADPSTTNDSSTDFGAELEAVLTLPSGTKFSAVVERLSYESSDQTVGNIDHYERDAAFFLLSQRFGPHYVWGGFGIATQGSCEIVGGADCSTDDLGATQFNIGYSFALAKTAEIFLAYYQLDNNDSATYNVSPAFGIGAAPDGGAPGATLRGFGLGFNYSFDGTWVFPL